MKIIFSRKGFDSQYGGAPSPIFPDGSFVSLPIGDRFSPIRYESIRSGDLSLGPLVEDLTKGKVQREHRAHLDPDLNPTALPREPGWQPIFGQADAALGHLRNQGVTTGDLFLFFGWFREVERRDGTWGYRRGSRPIHLLWGWMAIGDDLKCEHLPADVRRWAAYHPHLHGERGSANSLYLSAPEFKIGHRIVPGSGLFPRASLDRTLTEPGASPSRWRLPAWMHPATGGASLTYHLPGDRWGQQGDDWCSLQTVGKGQEFVLSGHDEGLSQNWLSTLFSDV